MTTMKNYYRIMLGRKSIHAQECYDGEFIGVGYTIDQDLTNKLPERWQDFNQQFRPVWLEKFPEKSKVAAGLACGFLHTVCKGIKEGDIVLCPNGKGSYWIGEVIEPYSYHPDEILPHRRKVRWYPKSIDRSEMSQKLQNSTGSIGTVSNITKYTEEIEQLLAGNSPDILIVTDYTVEDPSVFALEKHLEEFLVHNWSHTALVPDSAIYEYDGELVG